MKRPIISLGDALEAVHDLKPADAEAREAIRRMLGMDELVPTTPATPSVRAALPSSTDWIGGAASERGDPLRWHTAVIQHPEVEPAPRAPVGFTLEEVADARRPPELPAWLANGEVLAPDTAIEGPPPLPLFSRVQRRGILSAAIATFVEEGDLDVDRTVEILAARLPLTGLLRHPTPTLRRGVQLLLDRAAGMDPFLADQEALVGDVDDLLSDDRLEVLYFTGCPSRGVSRRPRGATQPWRAPASGTPVLVVTDLGIGGPLLDESRASVREWLRFARDVRARGHALLGLIPYEARRWPPLLARAIVLLHWSERTTAGEVRRSTRDALVRRR